MKKIKAIFKKYHVVFLSFLIVIFFIWSLSASYLAQKLQNSQILLNAQLFSVQKSFDEFKNIDQVKINEKNQEEIKKIKEGYKNSVNLYEQILDLKAQKQDTSDLDKLYSESVKYLSEFNYSSAEAQLKSLSVSIDKIKSKITANTTANSNSFQNAPASNTPPGSGFSLQSVSTDVGTFNVAIVAADLNSTKVVVDTASDSDCSNNCPVLSLVDYVSRSGAFAGINGPFFCPAEYPSCTGKTNSFDTLLMNKNKHYFNSDNNKYSTIPLVYFTGNTMGIRGQTLEWGRDTGVDAVIANHPLYPAGGNNMFSGSSDPKITSRGARTFVANKGNIVYIGIVYNGSASDTSKVLKAMGMENALGLDQGGSTALWFGGYKAGPGRGIPSALLFVHK